MFRSWFLRTPMIAWLQLADKNGGIGTPEMRIPSLIFGSFFVPIGLLYVLLIDTTFHSDRTAKAGMDGLLKLKYFGLCPSLEQLYLG